MNIMFFNKNQKIDLQMLLDASERQLIAAKNGQMQIKHLRRSQRI